MTISTTTTLNRYVGNASTTVFPYTYRILAATDLVVTKRSASTLVETTLVYPTDYSVSGVGNTSGGSITTTTAPATGDLLVIERAVPAVQPTSIRNQGSYFPETHENVFDRQTMVDQQQATALGRTFSLPKTQDPATYNMELPTPVAGQVLAWTSNGLTNSTVSPSDVVLPGEGRATGTLTAYLANNYVYNVLDYEADPLGALDSTALIQAAIDAAANNGGGVVTVPRGTYLALSLALKSKVTLQLLPGAVLQKNGGAAGTCIVNLTGSQSATSTALSGNAAIGDTDLSVTSSSGFAADDLVLVYDATYKYTTNGRNQEINRVASVSAGHVVLKNRLIGSYATASTATVVKLSAIDDAHILGGTLRVPSGTAGGAIYGVLCNDCSVEQTRISGPSDMPGIRFDQSRGIQLLYPRIRDGQSNSTQGTSYGWILNESCHNCEVIGVHTANVRENPISNNCRHVTVVACTDEGAYDNAFNTHGTGNDHIRFIGCKSLSSRQAGFLCSFAGNGASDTNISFDACEVYRAGSNGFAAGGDSGKEPKNISWNHCKVDGAGVVTATVACLLVQNAIGYAVNGGDYSAASINNVTQGIYLLSSTNGQVTGSRARDVTNGWGIQIQSCTDTLVHGNRVTNVASSNIRSVIANTNLVCKNNVSDDTSFTRIAGDRFEGNQWGTKYDEDRGATASVTDGATIAHNCVAAPDLVMATGSVASQFVSVTAKSLTTFTVAIKTDAGAAGSSQTIYWRAAANVA